MKPSCRGQRLPPEFMAHAGRLYDRFTPGSGDVEDLPVERSGLGTDGHHRNRFPGFVNHAVVELRREPDRQHEVESCRAVAALDLSSDRKLRCGSEASYRL